MSFPRLIQRCDRIVPTVVLAIASLAGCGDSALGPVTGTVTFRGNPVTAGTVEASNVASGMTHVADLTNNGTFEFQIRQGHGLLYGQYRVAIKPPRGNKTSLQYQPPKPVRAEDYPDIPKRYHDMNTSGFSIDVAPDGLTRFDFDMK